MVKTAGGSIESQLLAARARHLSGHAEGSLMDALVRLENLRVAIQTLDESESNEFFRYFPVAAIAVLETHFKIAVQSIVDAGSPYLERGLALTRDRLRSISEFVPSLHRKTITVGELIAHQLPFNSISSIEEALGTLLDGKFKSILASVCDPLCTRRDLDCSPIIDDLDSLWRDIAETFERRHILAHEAATNYTIGFAEAYKAVDSVTSLVMAIDALLWQTVWKTRPLTGPEMRDEVLGQYRKERDRLAQGLRLGRRYARTPDRQKRFRLLHSEWKQFAKQWTRWEAEEEAMGAMRVLVHYSSLERLYSARARDVAAWCDLFEPASVLELKFS